MSEPLQHPRQSYSEQEWTDLRDQAVFIGQLSQALTVEKLEAWIEMADRSLSIGPILDTTAFMRGGDELQRQIKYMRALLEFRRAVAETVGA